MPFTSKKQAGAMFAAKAGKSTLGIPPAVGADFVNASKGMDEKDLPLKKGFPPKKKFTAKRKK